jgi:hypothetical protein
MSILSRRSLVASAAALPVLAMPAVASAMPAGDDTFERIAKHRRLVRLEDEICTRTSDLYEKLPEERREFYSIFDRGTDIGKNDDPRWTANQTEYWAASDAMHAIEWSFVDRPPTSAATVMAILTYADEHEATGYEWPDSRHYFTAIGTYDRRVEEDWRASLAKAIALTLQRLAVQS